MRILVSGASGLIGKNFIRLALKQGHEVHALVRNPQNFTLLPREQVFAWAHSALPPAAAFSGVDAVVNLAGEGIADRYWTEDRKKRIVDSRLLGTKNIVSAMAQLSAEQRPKVFLSGSAIGIYGYSRATAVSETSAQGHDFLADLCRDWENEALRAQDLNIRVALTRTGIVLSREGGALPKMPPLRISDGRTWMSWIHIEDMTRALLFVLENASIQGAFNCVSPNAVENRQFTKELAKLRKVPAFGFVPRFALDVILGEASNVVVSSLKVEPGVLLKAGFKFLYPELSSALSKELGEDHLLDRYLIKDQFVPLKPGEVFPFFSRAENLEEITPPWLNFRIVSKSSTDIRRGTLIDYKLKIHGFPVRWRTLIKDWQENEFFIDEQLKGPYSKWHHVHKFDRVPGGCLLRDEITYRVPGALLGRLLLGKWIASDVNRIFSYRQKRVIELLEKVTPLVENRS